MAERYRIQSVNFFRQRLLTIVDQEALTEYLGTLSDEQDQIRQLVTTVMWHMRGALSREEAWMLSHSERQDIIKSIEERKKLTEKTGMALM